MDDLIKKIILRMKAFEDDIKDNDTRLAKLKAAWETGRDVWEHKRQTGTDIKTVAAESGLMRTTLEKFVRFYRFYPDGYDTDVKGVPLTWAHYLVLVYQPDSKVRRWYLQQAALNGWSANELRRRMRNNFYENAGSDVSADRLRKQTALALKEQALYTYSARVLKVIDGDTLKVEVDVGFSMRFETKVRLRGINAAEKGTKKGDAAKAFVEGELFGMTPRHQDTATLEVDRRPSGIVSECPLVVIKSYKSGKFGRFIADVWYLRGETDPEVILRKGRLLNQVLLDCGYAKKVE